MARLLRDGPRPSPTPNHSAVPSPSLSESIHCFRLADSERPRRSRARFTIEEREKVLGVRRQGACLRCRILKIQCSLENPCQPCLQSAVKGSERKVLSFTYCVRTRFVDVNIFDSPTSSEASAMQTETLLQTMSGLLARIATPADFTLALNPAAFNNTMISWLTDPSFNLPNGSIVGLCCSSLLGLQFQEDETTTSTDGLITDFRRFLLATSLAHSGWRDANSKPSINPRELCAASQLSGCSLLKRLDRILTPQFLARCGRESCQVLFLLVLGTVLGVGYSSTPMLEGDYQASPEFPSSSAAAEMLSPEFQRSPTLWLAMKEHLCQMLAHHLIFVGSMLGIRFETGVEQRIIETAVARWNKAEGFVWADVAGLEREEGRWRDGFGGVEMPRVVKSEETEAVVRERGLPLWGGGGVPTSAPYYHSPAQGSPPTSTPYPPPAPGPPQLVPVPCPEIQQFQPRTVDDWSSNSKSYLAMFEEQENMGFAGEGITAQQASSTPRTTPESRYPRQSQPNTQPYSFETRNSEVDRVMDFAPEQPQPPEKKRRSIWVVRPYDAGPGQGLVNVHARVRGGMGMDTIRAFV